MLDAPQSDLTKRSLILCVLAVLVAVVCSQGMPFAFTVAGGWIPPGTKQLWKRQSKVES
jgi:hypothetical protein